MGTKQYIVNVKAIVEVPDDYDDSMVQDMVVVAKMYDDGMLRQADEPPMAMMRDEDFRVVDYIEVNVGEVVHDQIGEGDGS